MSDRFRGKQMGGGVARSHACVAECTFLEMIQEGGEYPTTRLMSDALVKWPTQEKLTAVGFCAETT